MVAIGGMNITGSSLAPTSQGIDREGTGDNYVYDIDLTLTPNFTITWNFDPANVSGESNYFFDPPFVFPAGSASLGSADGAFSYSVTLADAVTAGMTSVTFSITGTQSDGFSSATDTDTITFNFIVCYAEDTRIATPDGESTVQDLVPGDQIVTADGRTVPVKWIGRTTITPMFNPADRLEPVRISAGAFGPDTPDRDLIVTADHGMILDDLVINASALVNGTSIDWYPWKSIGKALTYYHVETDAHDVILANNAPSETFLDMPNRRMFDNFAEYTALYGNETRIPEMDRTRITSPRLLPSTLRDRLNIPADPAIEQLSGNLCTG